MIGGGLDYLLNANPDILNRYATQWDQIGAELEGTFTKYADSVAKVEGTYWEGKAATAAHDRATGDQKSVRTLVDKLTGLSGQARAGATTIGEALQKARALIAQCQSNGWQLMSTVSMMGPPTVIGEGNAREIAQMNVDITAAYNAVVAADNAVRDALNVTRAELVIAFTSGASLGGDQGKTDGDRLSTDPAHLTDVQINRLTDAGELTPEQLTALRNGDTTTIPVAQMDYLNKLARSLDGKSPQEIQAIMEKLPPEAQRGLSNSLELVSNKNVSPAVKGDPGVPDQGGANLLPAKIQQSLTRSDLVGVESLTTGGLYSTTLTGTKLNGVADNQAIAKIVAAGDPAYRAGSDLDRELLDVGAKYLDAQTSFEQDPDKNFKLFTVDGRGADSAGAFTEPIFAAVGEDKIAVESLVTDKDRGKDFILDVLQHDWTDDGSAAKSLFTFAENDATVENPGDRTDETTATRMGRIMSAVGEATSTDEAWKSLSNIPGTDGQSAGQLNPDLLRSVSQSMSPYISDVAGGDRTDVRFDVTSLDGKDWTDPAGNGSYLGARNIFALMNTDAEAGKVFTEAAMINVAANENAFAHNPNAPHDGASPLVTAGRIQGLIDAGLLEESKDRVADADKAAEDAFKRKEQLFGLGSSAIGIGAKRIPVIGDVAWDLVDGQMDTIKESMIGDKPQPGSTQLTAPDFAERAHSVLSQATLSPELQQQYPRLFENGALKDWTELSNGRNVQGNKDSLIALLNAFDGTDDPGQEMRLAYNEIVRGAAERPSSEGNGK